MFCRCCLQSLQQGCKSIFPADMRGDFLSSSLVAWAQVLSCGSSPTSMGGSPKASPGHTQMQWCTRCVCKPSKAGAIPSAHRGRGQRIGNGLQWWSHSSCDTRQWLPASLLARTSSTSIPCCGTLTPITLGCLFIANSCPFPGSALKTSCSFIQPLPIPANTHLRLCT